MQSNMFFRFGLRLGLGSRGPQHELVNCTLGSFKKPLVLRKCAEMNFSGRRNVILSTGQTDSLTNIIEMIL